MFLKLNITLDFLNINICKNYGWRPASLMKQHSSVILYTHGDCQIKTLNYNTKPLLCCGQITLSNIDEMYPLAIPNKISLISMHIPSLVKIPCHKYSSYCPETKNMGVSRADNSIQIWQNLPISDPKPDLYNINAHTKFGENPLMFTQVIIQKQKRKYGHVSGR